MKLIDLLEVISISTNVFVNDLEDNLLSFYDGKNSIDEKFNDCEVLTVSVEKNSLIIMIRWEVD